MKKLAFGLCILLILPSLVSALDACDKDWDFDPNVDWIEVEFLDDGEYKIKIFNESDTDQLLKTFKIEADYCIRIDYCGTHTFEANSSNKLTSKECNVTIKTKGAETDIFKAISEERDELREDLDACIGKEMVCEVTIPETPDCTCQVDCFPEDKAEGNEGGVELGFLKDYWWIFVIVIVIIFVIILMFFFFRMRKRPTEDEGGYVPPAPPRELPDPSREMPPRKPLPGREFRKKYENKYPENPPEKKPGKPDFDFFKKEE